MIDFRKIFTREKEEKDDQTDISVESLPYDDIIQLLSLLYTFNHGDKVCSPFEYACKTGGIGNNGGDYAKFEKGVADLGYTIEDVILHKVHFKLKITAETYKVRIQNRKFYPSDIDYLILANKEGKRFTLVETPSSLQVLAQSGDIRAQGTCEEFIKKVGGSVPEHPDGTSSLKFKLTK